jgi:hypothetical protein
VHLPALLGIDFHTGAGQTSIRSVCDGPHDLQIAQQRRDRRHWFLRWALTLRLQKQLRLFNKTLADRGCSIAPDVIELPGFSAGEMVQGHNLSHARAVLGIRSRHGHQILHGHMGRDRSLAYLLLHRLGKQPHQCQPTRYPAQAAIQASRQLLQPASEALLQFDEQPAFFQRRGAFAHGEGSAQHQGFRFIQVADHGLDRVAPQLLQSCDALITIQHQVAIGLTCDGRHQDRHLLAAGRQRCHQSALLLGSIDPQRLPTPIQLVNLQSHTLVPASLICSQSELGLRGRPE